MLVRVPFDHGCCTVVKGCHFETVLRALAEGRIRWGFWPPETDPSTLSESGDGIWIQGGDGAAGVDSESDGEEEAEEDQVSESGEEGDEEGGEGYDLSDSEEEEESNETGFGGRFGALTLEDAGADSTEEE